MGRYSLREFVEHTEQQDRGHGKFELETERLLEVNLDGLVWMKKGVMVAYRGSIKFTREGILEHGIGRLLKRAVTGEGTQLTKAEGKGKLYLAETGKKITILELANEAIFVNGNDVLAFEPSINWDIKLMRRIAGLMAGGLFNVRLEGSGLIAVTTHYEPITLRVEPGNPVLTDPNATVAWSGNLSPNFRTDLTIGTFLGRSSGEAVQMEFDGSGFVIIQPYEEVHFQRQGG